MNWPFGFCERKLLEQRREGGKTPEQIIESSTRTNPAMDGCVGLYDQNYDTYIIEN